MKSPQLTRFNGTNIKNKSSNQKAEQKMKRK